MIEVIWLNQRRIGKNWVYVLCNEVRSSVPNFPWTALCHHQKQINSIPFGWCYNDHLNLPHEGGGVGQSVDQWLGVVSMTHKQTEGPVNGQLVPLTVALSRNGIPFNTSTCILQSVKSGLSHIFKYHLWTVMKTNAFACDLKEDTYPAEMSAIWYLMVSKTVSVVSYTDLSLTGKLQKIKPWLPYSHYIMEIFTL